MNIMDLFRAPTPATPTPPQNGPTGVNNPGLPLPQTQSTGVTAPNGLIPVQGTEQQTQTPASPLEAHKDVWQTDPNAKPDATGEVFQGVDPQKLMESASKIDFAKTVTPEQLQAIAKGGEDAVVAFSAAMNKVAQTVYAQSAFATTKIVDQALVKQQASFDERLPNLVKKFSVNENLQTSNPLLSNPAVTPLVDALTQQLVRKNPSATSAEIQTQVSAYFDALGSAFAPKPPETPASRASARAAKSEDWSAFELPLS